MAAKGGGVVLRPVGNPHEVVSRPVGNPHAPLQVQRGGPLFPKLSELSDACVWTDK